MNEELKSEYVIRVKGIVVERESKNLNIKTGEIEIDVRFLEVINKSAELPFSIVDDTIGIHSTRDTIDPDIFSELKSICTVPHCQIRPIESFR